MKRSQGAMTLAYPLPAFLVGTYDAAGRPNIMTAAWGGICNSEPPCIAVSIRPARHTFQPILDRQAFTVSIPSTTLATETDFAGIYPGKRWDKFASSGLTAVRSDLVDAPYVDECPVVIECSLYKTLELGSHTQFIGQIVDVKIDESCCSEGKPDIVKVDPLIFDASGLYFGLGAFVGKAFTMGKDIEPKA